MAVQSGRCSRSLRGEIPWIVEAREKLAQEGRHAIDDHMVDPTDFLTKGVLSTVASKAVLKCLYMARIARPEFYWAVNALAREVTKWNVACDKRMHRLISYIHHKQGVTMISYVGDDPRDCKLMLFCDASFAGDLKDSKSTSGSLLCLVRRSEYVLSHIMVM